MMSDWTHRDGGDEDDTKDEPVNPDTSGADADDIGERIGDADAGNEIVGEPS